MGIAHLLLASIYKVVAILIAHKAYSFDWYRFDIELRAILVEALSLNLSDKLKLFINHYRAELVDPYEGKPLPVDWQEMLENRDVHECGDFALTKYYRPDNCYGLGYEWETLSDQLPEPAANALLGFPVGPAENLFDPGRYGSYFQTPDIVRSSLATLQSLNLSELSIYQSLLENAVIEQRGVYVTF